MRTSHTTHKHKRRQAIPGLTPESVIEKMEAEAHGKNMRKVSDTDKESKDAVLPQARPQRAHGSGAKGIFATPDRDDDGRPGESGQPAVPDAQRDGGGTQISKVLKQMLGEAPPAELLEADGIGRVATNGEALAAVIMREALSGKQWAVEMVRDQTEGKPIRAAQVNNSDGEVEDMLDRVSQARLNQLAKGK